MSSVSAASAVRRVFLVLIVVMMATSAAFLVGRQFADPRTETTSAPVTDPGTTTTDGGDRPTRPADDGTTSDTDADGSPTSPEQPSAPQTPSDPPTTDAPDPDDDGTTGDPGTAGTALLQDGDSSDAVRELQARLRQLDHFDHDVTGYYGEVTAAAVKDFQAAQGLPATGRVDRATLDLLESLTDEPSEDDLDNTAQVNEPGPLDPRCLTGRVLCADKTSLTLRWVVDGEVRRTFDARFGAPGGFETGEGLFHVTVKSRDHVSSLYDASMPFALFFNGGEAVHFSPAFVADGYDGYSHGCVNLRDYDGAAWLFDQVQVGDSVVVYWS